MLQVWLSRKHYLELQWQQWITSRLTYLEHTFSCPWPEPYCQDRHRCTSESTWTPEEPLGTGTHTLHCWYDTSWYLGLQCFIFRTHHLLVYYIINCLRAGFFISRLVVTLWMCNKLHETTKMAAHQRVAWGCGTAQHPQVMSDVQPLGWCLHLWHGWHSGWHSGWRLSRRLSPVANKKWHRSPQGFISHQTTSYQTLRLANQHDNLSCLGPM